MSTASPFSSRLRPLVEAHGTAAELEPWLRCYGLENSPEARAQFVGLKATGSLYATTPRHSRSN